MKLYMSPTSPFARLVRVVIREKGLEDRIDVEVVNPWDSTREFVAVNPVSKVPTLVTDAGYALTESLLIAQYLEGEFPRPTLIPGGNTDLVYYKAGLGHALSDQGVAVIAGGKLDPERGAPEALVERRREGIRRTLSALEQALAGAQPRPDLGDLAVAVGLEYLDFRFADLQWRSHFAALAEWHEALRERPSLAETVPA